MSPSLSVNHLVSFDDISMDSPDPQYRPPSIKWKAVFQYETPISVKTQGNKTHKNQDVNNMLKGIKSLENGGLKRWTTKTTRS
jgi:hypothetical protein